MDQFGLWDYLMAAALIYSWKMYEATLKDERPENQTGTDNPLELRNGSGGENTVSAETLPLVETINQICKSGATPNPKTFLEGAALAFETVTNAFATGDVSEVAYLLDAPVRDAFDEAIATRKSLGESHTLTFIGLNSAKIVCAEIDEQHAEIDVLFDAKMIAAVENCDGAIISGDPNRVVDAERVWTFTRNMGSASANWTLVSTDS